MKPFKKYYFVFEVIRNTSTGNTHQAGISVAKASVIYIGGSHFCKFFNIQGQHIFFYFIFIYFYFLLFFYYFIFNFFRCTFLQLVEAKDCYSIRLFKPMLLSIGVTIRLTWTLLFNLINAMSFLIACEL